MTATIWGALADHVDPPAVPERPPELADPVSLAKHLDPSYRDRPHLQVVAAELKALEAGEFDRLMLNTPPQVGKSRTAVEWGAFWWLCLHPTHRIIIGCYGDVLAVKRGKAVRKLVEQYGAAYGLYLERGSASMKDWQLTTGGGVLAVGVGSGVTGQNGDLLLIDDPTRSRKDAESVRARDAVWDWYSADLSSRQSPGAPIVLIQTPWHPDDLRARVVAAEGDRRLGGRWRVVIMAAIAEPRPELAPGEPDQDPLGRRPGEPLSHPKIRDGDTRRLLQHWNSIKASVAIRDWRALWQCDPKAPEGVLVSWELLRERRCFEAGRTACDPSRKYVAVSVDPSGGGRDTAGIVGGYLSEDDRLHIVADRSDVMSSEAWARAACELAHELDADRFIVEKNYGGDMAKLVIRTAWAALYPDKLCPRVVEVVARRNKLLRAEPVGQQWAEGRIVTTTYLPDLEAEWATWTVGTDSPGRIDASVYLAYELLPVPKTGPAVMEGPAMMDTDLLGGLWGR